MNPEANAGKQPATGLQVQEGRRESAGAAESVDREGAQPALPWSGKGRLHPLMERVVFVVILVGLTIPVYAPALNRFFAADQLWYFAELKNDLSLSNGLKFLDYNAARTYMKGDQALFRPLLFGWQAVASSRFGYDYRAWNIANLLLHLLVVYLLYELLRSIQPGVFAGVFALVFSVLTKDCELVMWNHLGGYLLGDAILLLALIAIQRLLRDRGGPLWFWLAVYALSISTAMLCYEMAVICALLLIGYVGWIWKQGGINRSQALWLAGGMLAPLLLFGGLYLGHLSRVERLFWVGQSSAVEHGNGYLVRVLISLWQWTKRVFDPWYPWFFTPAFFRFSWTQNLICLPSGQLTIAPTGATGDPMLRDMSLVLLVGGGLLLCFRDGFLRGQAQARAPFAACLAMLLVAYAALNNLGRSYTPSVTYYTYFFSLISTALLYSVVDFSRLRLTSATAALALLLGMGAANARQSYCLSRQVGRQNADVDRYAAFVENFVNQHHNEQGFQFAVHPASQAQLDLLNGRLDPLMPLSRGFADASHPSDKSVRVSNLLYGKYYNEMLEATDAANHHYVITAFP